MKKKKALNYDKPISDADWDSMGKTMHGISGFPLEAQVAIRKMMGRPKLEKPKKIVSFRFDSDIVSHLKAHVSGYNTVVENMLREAIETGKL